MFYRLQTADIGDDAIDIFGIHLSVIMVGHYREQCTAFFAYTGSYYPKKFTVCIAGNSVGGNIGRIERAGKSKFLVKKFSAAPFGTRHRRSRKFRPVAG